jgi:SAM-dependent methyltransferase
MRELLSDRTVPSQNPPIVALEFDDEHGMTPLANDNPAQAAAGPGRGSFFELLSDLERRPGELDRTQVVASYLAWIEEAGAASTELFAAWFNVGVELTELGDKAGAIEAYRNTLSVRPSFAPAAVNLGILQRSSELARIGQMQAHEQPKAPPPFRNDGSVADGVAGETLETMYVLHVGCGVASRDKLPAEFRQPHWQEVRLDIDPEVGPDFIASITDMHVIPDEHVDAVYSSHNVEHLYPHEVEVALREMRRVLKPAGFVRIHVPDLQAVARHVAEGRLDDALYLSSMGPIAPLDILYGHRQSLAAGNTFMAHRTGFTCGTLANALINAGFAAALVQREPEAFALTAVAFRTKPGQSDLEQAQTQIGAASAHPAVLYSPAT